MAHPALFKSLRPSSETRSVSGPCESLIETLDLTHWTRLFLIFRGRLEGMETQLMFYA